MGADFGGISGCPIELWFGPFIGLRGFKTGCFGLPGALGDGAAGHGCGRACRRLSNRLGLPFPLVLWRITDQAGESDLVYERRGGANGWLHALEEL